jgi:hypothetical protein
MDRDAILVQLQAIRGICDALAAQLLVEQAPVGAGCPHPEDQRENASVMRGPRQFYCRACKEVIAESAPIER